MKILLAAVNAKYIHSNLAVYSLKAYAEKKLKENSAGEELEIEIGEYTINQQLDDILRDIYERKPDMLCFSCYIWNIVYVEQLVCEFAKIRDGVPIWLGGPEVSYDAPDVLGRLPQVKGVMKGEGEVTFFKLCESYVLGVPAESKLLETAGITFRTLDGQIVENSWRTPVDLSNVPFVYTDMEAFTHKIIYYETSRGCPFSCSYCLSSIDKKLRFRDMKLVKKELQFFIDKKVPQVKFVDRTFNCKHDHAMEIWKYILEHDNGITNFHFEISADLLNEQEMELIGRMRPGLIQLEIGVQSTNSDTIREIHRTMDLGKLRQAVLKVGQAGNIHQHLDLIAGLPYENIESFARSFDEVYDLKPHQLQLGFLKVLKGSYMEGEKERYGLVYKSLPPYEVLSTKWLSYEDILDLKGIEEMVEVYYNSRQFEHTMEELGRAYTSAFMMYERMWKFYKEHNFYGIQHKRSARYEILMEFVERDFVDKKEYYRELLIYDYYLRENAKTRPGFAGPDLVEKDEARKFYEKEAKVRKYLPGYEGYDKNQMRKMTHLEKFQHLNKMILFDYMSRNPLNQEARTCILYSEDI